MRKRSDRRRERGFSLVEVLCAVAIAASAIVVLTNGVNGSLKGVAALDKRLGARIILQSILEDELAAEATVPDEREGASGPYRWRLVIAPEESGVKVPAPHRLYRISGAVGWGTGAQVTGSVVKLAQ